MTEQFRLRILVRQRRASRVEKLAIKFWTTLPLADKEMMVRVYGEDWLRVCLQPYIKVDSGAV
jgi:hypothetical protein